MLFCVTQTALNEGVLQHTRVKVYTNMSSADCTKLTNYTLGCRLCWQGSLRVRVQARKHTHNECYRLTEWFTEVEQIHRNRLSFLVQFGFFLWVKLDPKPTPNAAQPTPASYVCFGLTNSTSCMLHSRTSCGVSKVVVVCGSLIHTARHMLITSLMYNEGKGVDFQFAILLL